MGWREKLDKWAEWNCSSGLCGKGPEDGYPVVLRTVEQLLEKSALANSRSAQ